MRRGNGHSKKVMGSSCVAFAFSRFSGFLPLPQRHACELTSGVCASVCGTATNM